MIGARLLSVGYPGVRGLTTPIAPDRALRVHVIARNTGNVTVSDLLITIFVGDELSPPTGDAQSDYYTWRDEAELYYGILDSSPLAPGEERSYHHDFPAEDFPTEGVKDVAVTLAFTYKGSQIWGGEYHEDDAVEIIKTIVEAKSLNYEVIG